MMTIFVFLSGLILGSFLNVCIYRMPKDESLVRPGSHCPGCGKAIPWHDNIPVASFIILMGRCRFCKKRISFRYPVVEMLTAFLMTALFLKFGLHPEFFSYALMTAGLIIVTFIDIEYQVIPDQVVYIGAAAAAVFSFLFPGIFGESSGLRGLLQSVYGILAGAGAIIAMKGIGNILFSKKLKQLGEQSSMGDGDMLLLGMIGAFLGWKSVLLAFLLAPFFGAPVGIMLKLGKGKDIIPYGPFLSLAALVTVFFAERVLGLCVLR